MRVSSKKLDKALCSTFVSIALGLMASRASAWRKSTLQLSESTRNQLNQDVRGYLHKPEGRNFPGYVLGNLQKMLQGKEEVRLNGDFLTLERRSPSHPLISIRAFDNQGDKGINGPRGEAIVVKEEASGGGLTERRYVPKSGYAGLYWVEITQGGQKSHALADGAFELPIAGKDVEHLQAFDWVPGKLLATYLRLADQENKQSRLVDLYETLLRQGHPLGVLELEFLPRSIQHHLLGPERVPPKVAVRNAHST